MKGICQFAPFIAALLCGSLNAQDPDKSYAPLGASIFTTRFSPKLTRYELTITDTTYNFTGKPRKGYAVNGQSPMPTLEFTEGDTALIIVHNAMEKEETSLHWHGIILPNRFDGVPYLTTPPIKAGETQVYKFPLVQSGTYWYHSHTNLQEQNGMHGALIIHKRNDEPLPEYTVILSEWTDMKPNEVHRRLHNANDWFGIQKSRLRPGTTQSYWDAIKEGYVGIKLANEWKRMRAMDVSDVYYDTFLANGKPEDEAPQFKAGDRVRIRMINGGASSYFWISYAGGKMSVVASDGMAVEPVEVDRFIIGVAETYDIIITIPADSTAYEVLATSEDRTRSTSVWLGKGIKQLAAPMGPLKYFEGMKMMNGMMRMNGDMEDMGMNMALQRMDMNTVMYPEITGSIPAQKAEGMQGMEGMQHDHAAAMSPIVTLNYGMMRSPISTALPSGPVKELRFELTGNMNRYLWTIDNKTVTEADKIMIRKGENVRLTLFNNSMMRHPMHLHGHFFRVLNGQGDHAPLKNVLDIMPMETDTIEFAGTEDGDWIFHCHILYHMMSGMGRVFSYEAAAPEDSSYRNGLSWKRFARDDKRWHFMLMNDFATNGSDGEAMLQSKRWKLQAEWRLGYTEHHGQEVETHFGRYLGRMQWWFPYIGFDWRQRMAHMSDGEENLFGQGNTKDSRSAICAGFQYTLPMLFVLDSRIDTDGRLRAQLMRDDIPLSPRARMDVMANTDGEFMARARYILSPTWALSTHFDSDMDLGLGVTLSY